MTAESHNIQTWLLKQLGFYLPEGLFDVMAHIMFYDMSQLSIC